MKRLLLVFTAIIIIFSISTSSYALSYMITGYNVNLRSTPTIDENNILTKLNYGDSIEIFNKYSAWYLVSAKEFLGYVSSDYVGINAIGTAAMITNNLNFRSGPGKSYKSYCIIPQCTMVKVLDTSSKWYQIQYNGIIGYVSSDYLILKNFKNEELLGTYTTFFSTASSQKGRVLNIQRSASLINEYVVKPKASFSILEIIGPITKLGGYQPAPEYEKTEAGTKTVMGYGGGVCQLATTLYQSVCEAKSSVSDIKILERHNHSKSVSYIEDGEDATISWDSDLDFVFKNNNNYPIKIRTFVYDGSITCMIYKCN